MILLIYSNEIYPISLDLKDQFQSLHNFECYFYKHDIDAHTVVVKIETVMIIRFVDIDVAAE